MKNTAEIINDESIRLKYADASQKQNQLYVVDPSMAQAIDRVTLVKDTPILQISQRLVSAYLESNPNHVLMDSDELYEATVLRSRLPVTEIDAETFEQQLGVLPPIGLQTSGGYTTFKLSEFYTADLTMIYVQDHVADRYFSFRDRVSTTHSECIDRVGAFKASDVTIQRPAASPGMGV